jgi:hypothetical protein
LPIGLVVKNGSKTLSLIVGSIPQLVSATSISRTPSAWRVRATTLVAGPAGVDRVGDEVLDHQVEFGG